MHSKWPELYSQHQQSDRRLTEDAAFNTFMELSEETDVVFDSAKAWNKVQQRLESKKSHFLKAHWWKVAAVVALLISTYVVFFQVSGNMPDTISILADDRVKNITLPDGSTVMLFKGATIEYSEDFETRKVAFKGLAYFDIQKDDTPFVIHLNDHSVRVLGTAFSISSDADKIEVYVEEGAVRFTSGNIEKDIHVQQLLTCDLKKNSVAVTADVDPNVLSWKTGKFVFNDTPFKEAIKYLEQYYQVDFTHSEQFNQCQVTARFDNEKLPKILEILESVLDAKFIQSNSNIQTIGKGCN